MSSFNRFHLPTAPLQPAPTPTTRPAPPGAPRQPPPADVSVLPRAAIDSEGGVRDDVHTPAKGLQGRQQASPRVGQPPQRQGRQRNHAEAGRKPPDAAPRSSGDDVALHMAVVDDVVDMLRGDSSRRGRRDVAAMLEDQCEPMEQWCVLRDALEGLEELALSAYRKKLLEQSIREMMADIVERDRGVRRALQAASTTEALEAAVEGASVKSARELRFLITEKGSIDKPLTPLATLKAIIRHLGVRNVDKAIATLCSQMLSGL